MLDELESEEKNEKNNATDMYNPRTLFSVLDTYEKLAKPMQITEITIPAYSDSAEDEKFRQSLSRIYTVSGSATRRLRRLFTGIWLTDMQRLLLKAI